MLKARGERESLGERGSLKASFDILIFIAIGEALSSDYTF